MTGELFYRRSDVHSGEWWQRFVYAGKERYLSAQECLKLRPADEVCRFRMTAIVRTHSCSSQEPLFDNLAWKRNN